VQLLFRHKATISWALKSTRETPRRARFCAKSGAALRGNQKNNPLNLCQNPQESLVKKRKTRARIESLSPSGFFIHGPPHFLMELSILPGFVCLLSFDARLDVF